MLRIGIVAGEPSGDQLAGRLLTDLRKRNPAVEAEGVGGPHLEAAGCRILHSMDELSVMGLVEVVGSYPRLLRLRGRLARHFRLARPDVFVGVDSPDFNLGLELALRRAGIRTVHYGSPQVWAWRRSRIEKIARAVDLMLTLLPFELPLYEEHGIRARYVGHPLADELPLEPDRGAARGRLGIAASAAVVAILPGSRRAELRRHAKPFLLAAEWIRKQRPEVRFAIAVVSEEAAAFCRAQAGRLGLSGLRLNIHPGRAHEVLAAADVALLASGTVSLEAMLFKRPMVVAYRMNPLTFMILRKMVHVDFVALPNLLAGRGLVPERLQGECRADLLGADVLKWLERPDEVESLRARFQELHLALRGNGSGAAAEAVLELSEP